MRHPIFSAAVPCLLLASACHTKPADSPVPVKDTAVVVNGRAVSEAEVQLRRRGRGPKDSSLTREKAIDQVVLAELEAQRAEQLGLDRDHAFLEHMEEISVQLRDARRFELAKLLRMREVVDRAVPAEAEVKAYFEAHQKHLHTEYHLQELLAPNRAAADADLAAIRGGARFEDVALARATAIVGPMDEGSKPYELPPLSFDRIPPEWWPAIDTLTPGAVSDVIAVGQDKYAILRLMETREGPEVKLEDARPKLEMLLKAQAMETRRIQLEAELLKSAKVERRPAPTKRGSSSDD